MKIWKKYEKYLLTGEWHVHTKYTDGKNSVFELCKKAVELHIPLIAFTEHVRKNLNYDFSQFLCDIENARDEFSHLIILSGVEAKVLPDGELDVEDEIIREVDYPIFAYHSFPKDINLFLRTLKKVLMNPYVNTWAHPGLFLLRNKLKESIFDIEPILKLMKNRDILMEINYKYNLPFETWIEKAKKVGIKFVYGGDVHSIEDLKRREGKTNI